MVSEEIKNRKGARKAQDIPKDVLELLNEGKIPTVNLTEWLAVDQTYLIKNTFQKIGLKDSVDNIAQAIGQQKEGYNNEFDKTHWTTSLRILPQIKIFSFYN